MKLFAMTICAARSGMEDFYERKKESWQAAGAGSLSEK